MTILSPSDDFWCRSLANFPGPVSRLDYISGLRLPGGTYSHWGLSRIHGDAAANQAIAGAHSKIFSELLSTPVRRLVEELRKLAAQKGTDTHTVLRELMSRGEMLIPQRLSGGSKRHFNSIWQALSALERALGPGNGRGA
jgi:hypothetical protein